MKGHNARTCGRSNTVERDPFVYMASVPKEKSYLTFGRKERVCKWCKSPGHNITTCQAMGKAMDEAVRQTANFRKNFIVTCEQNGFSVGSLIRDENQGIGMVTSFNPRYIHSKTLGSNASPCTVKWVKNGAMWEIGFPWQIREAMGEHVSEYAKSWMHSLKSKVSNCKLPTNVRNDAFLRCDDRKMLMYDFDFTDFEGKRIVKT